MGYARTEQGAVILPEYEQIAREILAALHLQETQGHVRAAATPIANFAQGADQHAAMIRSRAGV